MNYSHIKDEAIRFGYCKFKISNNDTTLNIAKNLGEIIPPKHNGDLIQILRIKDPNSGASPNTLSYKYGKNEFPYHTDGAHMPTPPRFILMVSKDDDLSNTPTEIVKLDLELFEGINNSWVINTGKKVFHSSLHTKVKNNLWYARIDFDCMEPADKDENKIKKINQKIDEQKNNGFYSKIYWDKNSAILINNWQTVHKRGLSEFHHATSCRLLERCYIKE